MWQLGLVWMAQQLNRDLQGLARRAGGGEALWNAEGARLSGILRGHRKSHDRWREARRGYDYEDLIADMDGIGAWFCGVATPEMPDAIEELPDPPFGLLGRGAPLRTLVDGRSATPSGRPVVAVVGSRTPTDRGRAFAMEVARDLAERGAVVVSGLANGIDAAAHRGCLAAAGQTIAVLGSSVDLPSPRAQVGLAQDVITGGGALIGEYWLGTAPAPWRFPARNRIIAGLSDAVVVVEAAQKSGALITADFALDLGRPVLAVPGPAGSERSAGCHALLRAGAALCESADDVAGEVTHRHWQRVDEIDDGLSGLDRKVTDACRDAASSVDELVDALGVSLSAVAQCVADLEIRGHVVRVGADRFGPPPRRSASA